MNPIAAYAECSFLDFSRRVKRKCVQEPLLAIGAFVAFALCVAFALDVSMRWGSYLEATVPFVVIGYSLYKILQEPPALSMRACVISFEMFSSGQLKAMFAVRSFLPTFAFVALYGFAGLHVTSLFVAACLMNIAANFISLTKHSLGTRWKSIALMTAGAATAFIAIASSSPGAPAFMLVAVLGVFVGLRSFTYDDWYPYCQSQQSLHDALVEGDRELISLSHQEFFKNATKRFLRVEAKDYDSFLYERISLSRMRDHWKGLLACILVSAALGVVGPSVAGLGAAGKAVVAAVPLMALDGFLATFNGIAKDSASMNPLLSCSFSQAVRRGYAVQAMTTALVALCEVGLFPPLSVFLLVPCCALFPVQNMYAIEASSPLRKIAGYVAKAVVVGLPLWGFFLPIAV